MSEFLPKVTSKKVALLTLVVLLGQATTALAQPKSGRWYYIQNKAFQNWLNAETDIHDFVRPGGPISIGSERKYRFLLTSSDEQGYYSLVHLHSSRFVESGGHTVHLGDRDRGWGPEYFLFQLIDAGDGYYYVRLKRTGGYLRVKGGASGPYLVFSDSLAKGEEDQFQFRFTEDGPDLPIAPSLTFVATEKGVVKLRWRDENHRYVRRYSIEVAGPFLVGTEKVPAEAKWRLAREPYVDSPTGLPPNFANEEVTISDAGYLVNPLEAIPFEPGKKYAVRVRSHYLNRRQAVSDYQFVTAPNPG
jgi:hypothetical protein